MLLYIFKISVESLLFLFKLVFILFVLIELFTTSIIQRIPEGYGSSRSEPVQLLCHILNLFQ